MKKLFPVFLGLLMPLASAVADSFVDEAVSFCRSRGGNYSMTDMVGEGDNYCRQVTCRRTTSERYEIPEGAPGPEANVEATKKVCVAKSTIDGNFNPDRASSGAAGGSSVGGRGGSGEGGKDAGAGGGGGVATGSSSTAVYYQTTTETVLIPQACHKKCSRREGGFLFIGGRRVTDTTRPDCVRCLADHNIQVTAEHARASGITVQAVRTTPVVSGGGSVVVTTGAPSVSTGVVTTTGPAVGGGGGVVVSTSSSSGNMPPFCSSSKASDRRACEDWIRDHARFQCSQGGRCIDEASISARYDRDCPNCGVGSRQQSTLSGIAEIAGAVVPGLAALGVGYFQSRAQIKSNQAWAGAAASGFEQCRLAQQNYLAYLQSNEAPVMTPEQQAQMNCNGYGFNQFAGLGGGMNGYYGAGYSPGFIGGMMGPYGMYNPYGMGGMGGGIGIGGGIGMSGGMYPGMGMTGMTGMSGMGMGGFVNGVSIGGGLGMSAGSYPSIGYPGIGAGIGMGGGMNGGMYPGFGGGMWGSGVGTGMGYPGANGGYWGATGGNFNQLTAQITQADLIRQQQGAAYNMGQMQMGGYGGGGLAGYSPMNMGASLSGGLNIGFGGGMYGF